MKAASKGTYLSKKQMSAYTQKRDEYRQKLSGDHVDKAKAQMEAKKPETETVKPVGVTEDAVQPKPKGDKKVEFKDDSSDDELNRSVGECDSDELDGDLNLSDDEQMASNLRTHIK